MEGAKSAGPLWKWRRAVKSPFPGFEKGGKGCLGRGPHGPGWEDLSSWEMNQSRYRMHAKRPVQTVWLGEV